MKTYHFLTFLCCALAFTVNAQTLEKDSITNLSEVTVLDSIYKLDTSQSIPITATTFQNYSPVNITSSLNEMSGIFVLSGAINTNRITIRGIGARTPYGTNKLRLYYNNIPITNGTGASSIEAFDLENLQQIDIVKGPKGTSYGSNLGGAIVLSATKTTNNSTSLHNSLTVGSYGLLKNNIGFTHKKEAFSLSFKYGHTQMDGYRENSNFNRDGILVQTEFPLSTKTTLGLLVNYIDYQAQIPSSISKSAFDTNPRQAAFTWKNAKGYEDNAYLLSGASLEHRFNTTLSNTTSIFYTYLDHYEPRPFNILDEFTNGYGGRTAFKVQKKSLQFTFGGEYYKDVYHWSTLENLYEDNNGEGSIAGEELSRNKENRQQYFLFSTATYSLSKKWKAIAGLNLNHTFYEFTDEFNTGEDNLSGDRHFNPIILPSFTLQYSPSEQTQLYANISRGFSNPSLEETLTPEGVTNPDIKQETGNNYEIGSSLSLFKNHLHINLTAYRMDIKNMLVAQRVDEDQYIGKNAGSTKHQGIEMDIFSNLSLSSSVQLKPFAHYTYSDHSFVRFIDGDNNYSGNPLTGVPKHNLNTGIQVTHTTGFFWNTTYQYVSKIPLQDSTASYSDSYGIANTKIGYATTLSRHLTLGTSIGVNNVFNTKYASSILINAVGFGGAEPRYYYPGNNTNVYGNVQLKYIF